jgi:hypothetical protein
MFCRACGHKLSDVAPGVEPKPAGVWAGDQTTTGDGAAAGKKGKDKGASVHELLLQAIAATKKPKLQSDLHAHLDKLGEENTSVNQKSSVSEEFRRADGCWRGAEHRHQQAVAHVVRLRSNLAAAKEKERAAARALAEAAGVQLKAAQAIAKAEGVQVEFTKGGGDGEKEMISAQ